MFINNTNVMGRKAAHNTTLLTLVTPINTIAESFLSNNALKCCDKNQIRRAQSKQISDLSFNYTLWRQREK